MTSCSEPFRIIKKSQGSCDLRVVIFVLRNADASRQWDTLWFERKISWFKSQGTHDWKSPCLFPKRKQPTSNKAISAAVVDVTVAAEWCPFFACDVAAFCFGSVDSFVEHDDDDDDAGKLLLWKLSSKHWNRRYGGFRHRNPLRIVDANKPPAREKNDPTNPPVTQANNNNKEKKNNNTKRQHSWFKTPNLSQTKEVKTPPAQIYRGLLDRRDTLLGVGRVGREVIKPTGICMGNVPWK